MIHHLIFRSIFQCEVFNVLVHDGFGLFLPAPSRLWYEFHTSGDGEIRTHDPLLARQVLSQLSYTPIWLLIQLPASSFSKDYWA